MYEYKKRDGRSSPGPYDEFNLQLAGSLFLPGIPLQHAALHVYDVAETLPA